MDGAKAGAVSAVEIDQKVYASVVASDVYYGRTHHLFQPRQLLGFRPIAAPREHVITTHPLHDLVRFNSHEVVEWLRPLFDYMGKVAYMEESGRRVCGLDGDGVVWKEGDWEGF